MPLISIVTPVRSGGHDYLPAAYESLCSQAMPSGWEWEWIVQEDGQTGLPASVLPADARISTGMEHQSGTATARTLALGRVQGELVRALDADGLLPPGALERAINVLTQHRDVAWCVSTCLDLLPDGSLRPHPHNLPAGPLAEAVLLADYEAGGFPAVGTTLTTYADLVYALGGWPAVPASEVVALLLLCEAVSQGWMIEEPGAIYRKQSTTQTAHWDPAERSALDVALLPRLDALRTRGWRWTPSHHFASPEGPA